MNAFTRSAPYILAVFCFIHSQHLGINIDFAERGGTFVDLVKENYRWSRAGEGGDLTRDDVDEYGWPTVDARYILDFRPVAEWSGDVDDPDTYRIDVSGTYECSFKGSGSVQGVTGGSVEHLSYDEASNTTTFDFVVTGPPGDNHGFILIDFTDTKRTPGSDAGSGFTDFRMNRPGYELTSDKIFTDAFISALTGVKFAAIRFMNFSMTNGCDPEFPAKMEWDDRKKLLDASQDRIDPIGKTAGGAWEYVTELCNTVMIDPWINIPVSASEEYIRSLAQFLKGHLSPSLHLYVESSNEVWNTAPGFEQSVYSQTQADDLGIGEHENHARRTVEIATIFGEVFGETTLNDKIRVVLCSHKPMLKWWVIPMLDYIAENYDSPDKYIYAIASQTYFGGGTESGKSIDDILQQCRTSIESQIDEEGETNEAGRVQWVKVASDYNLKGGYCSYEGGPDHGGGSTENVANCIRAERDDRMGKIWTYNLDSAFFQVGGNLAMQFTLSSAYTRYGCWGLTDDITVPDRNSKYSAAKNLADKYPMGIKPEQTASPLRNPVSLKAGITGKGIEVTYRLSQTASGIVSLWNPGGKRLHHITLQKLYCTAGDHSITLSMDQSAASLKTGYCIVTVQTEYERLSTGLLLLK